MCCEEEEDDDDDDGVHLLNNNNPPLVVFLKEDKKEERRIDPLLKSQGLLMPQKGYTKQLLLNQWARFLTSQEKTRKLRSFYFLFLKKNFAFLFFSKMLFVLKIY